MENTENGENKMKTEKKTIKIKTKLISKPQNIILVKLLVNCC